MIAAATCWRFADVDVARPRVVDEPAAGVRVERAAFAASPRTAAAFDEAARDAAVRFDAPCFAVVSSAASSFVAADFAAAAFAEAAFAAVDRGDFAVRADPAAPEPLALGAGRATDDPRSADTPVPVPSGVSSW